MKNYLDQLIADIEHSTQNVSWPFIQKEAYDLCDWKSYDEEEETAPTRELEVWTGIQKYALPPSEKLTDEEVDKLFKALSTMLDAYNCSFVIVQYNIPIRLQYNALRGNFDQVVKVKQWHQGFFALCKPGTSYDKCALGEFCQCAFIAELCSQFIDDDRTSEEQRAADLEMEISYLRKKHGCDWMKYYPYHLDKEYDDEYGNPYDYLEGFYDDDDDD